MARMQLVSNVSKWGMLQWPAQSRSRLVIFTLLVSAATGGLSLWGADYAINRSHSVMLNLIMMTSCLVLLVIAAFSQAVLVGDLFFGSKWREQIFLGKKPVRSEHAHDERVADERSAEFLVLLICLFVANGFAINTAAGGFMDYYQNEGFSKVRLRADEPSERIAALVDIADPFNQKLGERSGIQDAVVASFADPDDGVRAQGVWTAGRLKMQSARPALMSTLGDAAESSAVRAQAAISLGKLGNDTESRRLLEQFATDSTDHELQLGCVRGLGLMASGLSVATLGTLAESENEGVMVHAFWALGQVGNDLAREVVKKHVDAEPTGVFRCAVYDAFKMTATKDDTMWARREFQRIERSDNKEDDCARVFWEDGSAKIYDIVWGETVRIKLLKIVANTNPFDHQEWIQRLVNDPSESWRVREVADEVLKQMKKAKQ